MIGTVRDSLNQAPRWVSYAIAGVVLVVAVGLVAWQVSGPSSRVIGRDKHFYCPDCDDGFTVTAEESSELMREAAKANPGGRPLVKCRKCGKFTCALGRKCPKCNQYFEPPEKSTKLFPDSWRDECAKCGYSAEREKAVRAAFRRMKAGDYDPNKVPEFVRIAVEEAEKSGEYKDE